MTDGNIVSLVSRSSEKSAAKASDGWSSEEHAAKEIAIACGLSDLEYERRRQELSRALRVRVSFLDNKRDHVIARCGIEWQSGNGKAINFKAINFTIKGEHAGVAFISREFNDFDYVDRKPVPSQRFIVVLARDLSIHRAVCEPRLANTAIPE